MFTRLKLLIKLRYLKVKMNYFEKRHNTLRNKTSRYREKLAISRTNWAYANERLHPEETWEMRAVREFERLNL